MAISWTDPFLPASGNLKSGCFQIPHGEGWFGRSRHHGSGAGCRNDGPLCPEDATISFQEWRNPLRALSLRQNPGRFFLVPNPPVVPKPTDEADRKSVV